MSIPKQPEFKQGFMEVCVKSNYRQFCRIVDDMNEGIVIDRAEYGGSMVCSCSIQTREVPAGKLSERKYIGHLERVLTQVGLAYLTGGMDLALDAFRADGDGWGWEVKNKVLKGEDVEMIDAVDIVQLPLEPKEGKEVEEVVNKMERIELLVRRKEENIADVQPSAEFSLKRKHHITVLGEEEEVMRQPKRLKKDIKTGYHESVQLQLRPKDAEMTG